MGRRKSGHMLLGARPVRVLMTGGGTGGHVYPAIAIADAVRKQRPDAVIAFAGSNDRIEWRAVPAAGYEIHAVRVQALMRRLTPRNILRNLILPFRVGKGVREAMRLVRSFDADVAVGTGGFVTGPVVWAAHLAGRPVLIQEQNAHVGLTNRLLARVADRIHTAFTETLRVFPADRTTVSGNPTRSDLPGADPDDARTYFGVEQGQRVLLVLGGSGGSKAINEYFARRWPDYLDDPSVVLIWQSGEAYFDRLEEEIEGNPRLKLVKFIDRMDYAYAAAELVICRSGASTCSELMVTGSASILIPSPNVAEDHQTRNAESMVRMGAAVLVPESRMLTDLFETSEEILADRERLSELCAAALAHATPDAADQIASDVLRLAERRAA